MNTNRNGKSYKGGKSVQTTLKKQGNSDALTFRAAWKEGLGIDANTILDVTVDYENRRLIVEPAKSERKQYDIKELAAIAKNQEPPELDEFDPVGDEIL